MGDIRDLEQTVLVNLGQQFRQLLDRAARGELRGEELLDAAAGFGQAAERAAVTEGSRLAAAQERAPSCPECGRAMRRHDRPQRSLVTLRGEVIWVAQRWRCRSCGTAACPGWEQLDTRHGCTRATWKTAVTACALLPFEQAEALLRKLGVWLSDNLLQRLTREVGGAAVASREAEARAVMNLELTLRAGRRVERLYVLADGYSAQVDREWREPRAGVVYETAARGLDEAGEPPPAERVSVLSTLADAEALMRWLTAETQRRGVFEAAEVVLLSDGAPWLRKRLRELVPVGVKVVEILDWYHACENLAKAVRAVYGQVGNQVEYQRLKRWLWRGRTRDVLERLAELAERVTDDRRRQVWNVRKYLRTTARA